MSNKQTNIFEDILGSLKSASEEFACEIAQVKATDEVERMRVKFLGRKSAISLSLRQVGSLPADQRSAVGKRANELRLQFQQQLALLSEAITAGLRQAAIDVTLPGRSIVCGHLHPITQTLEAILSIFTPLGFEIIGGPEIELESYNFDKLNIPAEHPSRESFDTFFVDAPSPNLKAGRLVLRSHTSPVQIRVMENRRPPVSVLVPGKVFRPDALDPGHSFMFHQVEGLVVDDRTSFADLKGVLEYFLKELFGEGTQARFRPHYFPFTEPSAEVDISCAVCRGKGCPTCRQKGWIEIMGCGMVHPNVLKGVHYDPRKFQGYAFGMGVERIAMLKHNIQDIRLFFENDVRFLEQF